jgi:N-hydroxyarylamine O-acetyltransferase
VPMSGEPVQQFHWRYRVVEETPAVRVLQSEGNGGWTVLYAFSLEVQEHVDFEMANYYVSTHPDSRFVRTLTVQLPSPEQRRIQRNRELITDTGAGIDTAVIGDDDALLTVLLKYFELEFPPGTRFRFEEGTGLIGGGVTNG